LTRDEARRIAANIAKLRCPDLGIYRCCIVSLYRFRPHPQASFRLPGHAFFVVIIRVMRPSAQVGSPLSKLNK
jgi:hypothetical protein